MVVFLRPLVGVLATASLLGANGCCGIASFFCGPDKSRWVSRGYRTPQEAIASLLEAIGRDRPDVIYEALSESAKTRYGLPGVVESTVAWEHLKREVTGLHMAGSANVSAPYREPDGRVRFDLAVAGRTLVAYAVEQPFWEVWYTLDSVEGIERDGRFVDARTLAKILVVRSADEMTIDARLADIVLPEAAQIREVRVGKMWKIDEIVGLNGS